MVKRQGNNPKRRIVSEGAVSSDELRRVLGEARYGGSALHKRRPGDYKLKPAVNPRPNKSVCDDLRSVLLREAQGLLKEGIRRGLVSAFETGGFPKYVWAVDAHNEPYEAKVGEDEKTYHGYRLSEENEPDMRDLVLSEWNKRP
ncbi:hypothetical protein [Pararhodospirillum photometricum]|uniref:hypothetical protein n=1 Tax=Pararhodospirillum photometricum TaxID=1084 RepID=UPI0005A1E90B|nr:hypothetical protein [Pararhodospirillum photometricum]